MWYELHSRRRQSRAQPTVTRKHPQCVTICFDHSELAFDTIV